MHEPKKTKPKNLKININGSLPAGVYAKDIILYLINQYGVDFGTGYALEFTGETIKKFIHGSTYDDL